MSSEALLSPKACGRLWSSFSRFSKGSIGGVQAVKVGAGGMSASRATGPMRTCSIYCGLQGMCHMGVSEN